MKKIIRIFPGVFIILFFINSLNAQVITGTPPTVTITDIGGTAVNVSLNGPITSAWNQLVIDATSELEKFSNQQKLAKGFANANLYASRPATLQGYQDYSLFALTTGLMVGIQCPAFQIDAERVRNIRNDIFNDGDIYIGMSTGIALVNAGINAGFLIPGLYFNFTYGFFSFNGRDFSSELAGFIYETSLYSIGVNYNIVWSRTIIPGLLKWRGISIGTGFSYAGTKSSVELTYVPVQTDYYTTAVGTYNVDVGLSINPLISVDIQTKNMTIPLDLSTSIKLFYVLNFNFGIGVDFNYGFCDIAIDTQSEINVNLTSSETITATTVPGYATVHGGAEDVKASIINPRLTTGLGFNFSVVKIDIPIAVYLDAGFSAGISAGIVW